VERRPVERPTPLLLNEADLPETLLHQALRALGVITQPPPSPTSPGQGQTRCSMPRIPLLGKQVANVQAGAYSDYA
jgi:hypothetical protein